MTATHLPEGFDLRYNGDTTHSLTFRGAAVTMEWVKAQEKIAVGTTFIPEGKREDFEILGVIDTGRTYTWYLDRTKRDVPELYTPPVLAGADPFTGAPAVEVLAWYCDSFYVFAFLDSSGGFEFIPGGGRIHASGPLLVQPTLMLKAVSKLKY